jgi:lipid A 4'-phosphatase
MRRRAGLILLAATGLAVVVSLAAPRLDLAVARWTFGAGHFLLDGSVLFGWLHRWIGLLVGLCLGFFGLAAVAARLGRPIAGLGPWHAVFVFALFIVGPGLIANSLLKDHSGRPRPYQVREFGGPLDYVGPLAFDGTCTHNCSFVSGDASAAFAYIGPALLLPRRRRALGVVGALLLGAAAGLMRMFQGGHFLCDVIFAGLVVAATALALHWAIFRDDGRPRWGRPRWPQKRLVKAGRPA